MKNYCMQLIGLYIAFIACNIIASESQKEFPMPIEYQQIKSSMNLLLNQTYNSKNNRLIEIGNFPNSDFMVSEIQKIVLDLHKETNKSILLCPNMKYERTQSENNHWVVVERYVKKLANDGKYLPIPIKCRDTNYQINYDLRSLENSKLIIYLLHNKALQVIPEIGKKSSVENSKEKHMKELSFMFNENNNDVAPIFVLINEDCVIKNKIEELQWAFLDGDIEKFLECLQIPMSI